ncbi:MAG TPA: hypothetical protein VGH19_24260 [Verrucomicrobiae bacterium]
MSFAPNRVGRPLKAIVFLALLCIAGFYAYVEFIYPATWHSNVRRESIKLLKAAQTTGDLTNAVGDWGIVIPLTNNQWIAIRYRDNHAGGIRSMAVASDSGGGWYESRRHFCGSLVAWVGEKRRLEAEEELQKLLSGESTRKVLTAKSENGLMPSYQEISAIELAPDLEKAREALKKIGFTELRE